MKEMKDKKEEMKIETITWVYRLKWVVKVTDEKREQCWEEGRGRGEGGWVTDEVWGGVDRIEMVCHVLRPKGLTKSEVFTTGKQLELFKPIQTYNMQCDPPKKVFFKKC